jgi:hypothetical protein
LEFNKTKAILYSVAFLTGGTSVFAAAPAEILATYTAQVGARNLHVANSYLQPNMVKSGVAQLATLLHQLLMVSMRQQAS